MAGSDLAAAAGQGAAIGEIDQAAILNRELNRLRIIEGGGFVDAPGLRPPAPVPQTATTTAPRHMPRAIRSTPRSLEDVLDITGGVIAMDFETASPARWSVCEVGFADPGGGVWDTLIDPRAHFAPGNIRVHGITAEAVEGAPTLDQLAALLATLDGLTVIAHNVEFERSVVDKVFSHVGGRPPNIRWRCTLDTARVQLPHLTNHRLPTVAAAVGADMGTHHTAADDAAAAMAIAQRLG